MIYACVSQTRSQLMTQLIPANLPLFYQCLRVSAEWREKNGILTVRPLPDNWMTSTTPFDPWEKRNEFFALKRGDTERLVKFLTGVGLFERPDFTRKGRYAGMTTDIQLLIPNEEWPHKLEYTSEMATEYVWIIQKLLMDVLSRKEKVEGYADFQARIERVNGSPQVVFTTFTFLDATFLTLTVDQATGAKVRKCARPDCGIPFTKTTGHKRKFHCWYCGHIESVRRQRRKKRKRKAKKRRK